MSETAMKLQIAESSKLAQTASLIPQTFINRFDSPPPNRAPCPSLSDRFLSFKRRGIPLKIQEMVRPAPHHAAKPKWLSERLLKTAHNRIPGFIRDPDRQPGLVPHIIV